MAGVSQNIDPPPPSPPGECVPPAPPLVRGEDTLAKRRGGWGVNILEDARHSSVLYVCGLTSLERAVAGGRPPGRRVRQPPAWDCAGWGRRAGWAGSRWWSWAGPPPRERATAAPAAVSRFARSAAAATALLSENYVDGPLYWNNCWAELFRSKSGLFMQVSSLSDLLCTHCQLFLEENGINELTSMLILTSSSQQLSHNFQQASSSSVQNEAQCGTTKQEITYI